MHAVDALIGRLASVTSGPVDATVSGRVRRTHGQSLEVTHLRQGLGADCLIEVDGRAVRAEVVGFSDDATYVAPLADVRGIQPGARVRPATTEPLPAPTALLGRVIDGLGHPLDGNALPSAERSMALVDRINPLARRTIKTPLDVGVRSINGLLTVGIGQRIGLFAGSGVGKSVLLGMMSRFTRADAVVVALIGERGREVREFIDENLGPEGRARAVVVAAPADDAPVLRLRAARLATAIAGGLRAAGKNVLLVVDSLTRVAQAQREIGLAVGEPPTTKGYPPSVFSLLPRLVEQAGAVETETGSITAFYTVLAEGDDQQDPIADAARAILDGHIVLSRRLADAGHYPAIDIASSISRVMPKLIDSERMKLVQRFRELWVRYAEQEDLISIGAYAAGSDPLTDRAIQLRADMQAFLRQADNERVDVAASFDALARVINKPTGAPR
jgi:flagellum-specific ATP synthase